MDPLNNSPFPPQGMEQPQMQTEQMATPEQKQELMDLIEKTKGNLANINTAKLSSSQSSEKSRLSALRQVFAVLQRAGVNLEDPESVMAFIVSIREKSPELATLLEQALESLITGQTPTQEEQPQMEMPPMGMPPQQEPPMPMPQPEQAPIEQPNQLQEQLG